MNTLRPDFEAAASVSIAGCDTCACGAITLRLHDADGATFAAASIGPEIAEAFLARVAAAVAHQKAGGLAAIRCEGIA